MRRILSSAKLSSTSRLTLALCLATAQIAGAAAADPLSLLREGRAVVLVRHANAPGTGDPPGMRLDACATQRNLDETGRQEAVALGTRLRDAGIDAARVFTSRWCRSRDTATLLGYGPPTALPAIDSFFDARNEAAARTAALRAFLAALPAGAPVVLVTHQVNITALTEIVPAPAEMVFVEAAPPHAMLGRLR